MRSGHHPCPLSRPCHIPHPAPTHGRPEVTRSFTSWVLVPSIPVRPTQHTSTPPTPRHSHLRRCPLHRASVVTLPLIALLCLLHPNTRCHPLPLAWPSGDPPRPETGKRAAQGQQGGGAGGKGGGVCVCGVQSAWAPLWEAAELGSKGLVLAHKCTAQPINSAYVI